MQQSPEGYQEAMPATKKRKSEQAPAERWAVAFEVVRQICTAFLWQAPYSGSRLMSLVPCSEDGTQASEEREDSPLEENEQEAEVKWQLNTNSIT